MKITVYVDGFNLYFGALKDTPYRWLDIHTMCQLLFPNDTIGEIKYFTARVSARPHDPEQPLRQEVYLRALKTIPHLSIIEGSFLTKEVTMPIARTKPQEFVQVIKSEEKGSDVNLAVHLIHDGHQKNYECAVIISNDSDLLEAIKIVRSDLNLPVGLINPHKYPSFHMRPHATFMKQIRKGLLSASQFPTVLTDMHGTISKPVSW